MTATEFGGLALSFTPVRGARAYNVDGAGVLVSPVKATPWSDAENRAQCRKVDAPLFTQGTHDMSNCTCGFYAYYDGSNDYRSSERVEAIVEGYGQVVIGTRGFRASKARIIAMVLPELPVPAPVPTPVVKSRWRTWRDGRAAKADQWLLDNSDPAAPISAFKWYGYAGTRKRYNDAKELWFARKYPRLRTAIGMGTRGGDLYERLIGPKPAPYFNPGGGYIPAPLPEAQNRAVRAAYPNVPTFPTFEAMVDAFPPDRGEG